jgi:hypothetical protein
VAHLAIPRRGWENEHFATFLLSRISLALRQRLGAENPNDPLPYPTMFLAPQGVPKLKLRFIAPPEPFRMLGFRGYRWFVGELIAVFLVDQRRGTEEAKMLF